MARYDSCVDHLNPARPSREPLFSSLAAIGSVLASMTCCLPLVPVLFGAGAAAASAMLAPFRPYFLIASVAFLAFAFYKTWAAKRCGARPSLTRTILLYFAAAVVVVSIFFPQLVATLLAG